MYKPPPEMSPSICWHPLFERTYNYQQEPTQCDILYIHSNPVFIECLAICHTVSLRIGMWFRLNRLGTQAISRCPYLTQNMVTNKSLWNMVWQKFKSWQIYFCEGECIFYVSNLSSRDFMFTNFFKCICSKGVPITIFVFLSKRYWSLW